MVIASNKHIQSQAGGDIKKERETGDRNGKVTVRGKETGDRHTDRDREGTDRDKKQTFRHGRRGGREYGGKGKGVTKVHCSWGSRWREETMEETKHFLHVITTFIVTGSLFDWRRFVNNGEWGSVRLVSSRLVVH